MDDLGKSMYEYLFVIFSFRCAIMFFGEALVLAFLATAVALFGVSVRSFFTSKHNSIADGIEKTGGSDDGKVRLESFNALQCIQLKIKSVEEKLKLDFSTR